MKMPPLETLSLKLNCLPTDIDAVHKYRLGLMVWLIRGRPIFDPHLDWIIDLFAISVFLDHFVAVESTMLLLQ